MIQSFRCRDTQALFTGERVPARLRQISSVAGRRLLMLHEAGSLADLGSVPGNRLKPLVGDRAGQHSIRVNDQYRICFRWTTEGPADVEIVDYH